MQVGSAPRAENEIAPAQVEEFRHRLRSWYKTHARILPWRGTADPFRIWVSEVMLQQTRVAAVIEHFERFTRLFPTIPALAEAREEEVLAAWSGLGYYRRARMLHRAAQSCVRELGGEIPQTATQLRELPGIGDYTCAAIASIAFGESIPVVDGNVERVLLRVTGRPEDQSAAGRRFIREQAARLVPEAHPDGASNPPGDHNQAMMELGATICLPKGPLCLNCPVYALCRTRGEHRTLPRARQRIRRAAYLLATRKKGPKIEVLLERRPTGASLMPGMFELPPLPLDALDRQHPVLRLRHSITNTIYAVEIYADDTAGGLRRTLPARKETLSWHPVVRLEEVPLTGLARKVLRKSLVGTAAEACKS